MSTYQVSAGADDGFAQSAAVQDTTSAFLKIGDERTYAVPYQMSAMRFNNVNIPRSATITSAYLKISSINTDYRGQIYGVIAAEASDNPADFSGRLIGNAALTAASVVWDYKTAWSPDTQYISPDISNIVQEVVSRSGFSSGNSIAIYYSTRELSGKARSFASYEYSPSSAAVLEVTYETYTISGYILTTEATPLENVTVSAGTDIEGYVTDASGYYELKVPPGWSGTVTVSKTDWGFSPANQPYSNVSSDQPNQDYTAIQPKISGYVKDGTGTGVEGVAVSADNGGGSDTTDATGFYEITVPYDWSGTVTVFKPGWVISPSYRSYTDITTEQIDQNYLAAFTGQITVNGDGTADFINIQPAIDAALTGYTIVVAEGTYFENINFGGKDIVLRSTDPNDPTIIAATIIDSGESGSVVIFSGTEPSSCRLSGLTIINGRATYGGGIYGNNTKATIADCVITSNSAEQVGGGLYDCNGLIENCTISDNWARYYGGGLYDCDGSIENCTISGNSISFESGGGLYDCDGTISNCVISGNTAKNNGGGLYGCSGLIENCTISDNSAGYDGGGLHSCNGSIENCIISGNSAYNGGGGLRGCNGLIENCTISGNSARHGGGLYACNETVQNCTISNNSASYGGGLHSCNGTIRKCTISGNSANYQGGLGGGLSGCNATIRDCIIIDNSADSQGGGLRDCDGIIQNCIISNNSSYSGGGLEYCDATIRNCTISNNSANVVGGLYSCGGSMQNCIVWANLDAQMYDGATPNYSCIQDWTGGGVGNISDNPLFVDANNGDYHLSTYSPCIDTGDPSYIAGPDETDMDGDSRVIRRIDIGADEFSGPHIETNKLDFYFTAYGKSDTDVAGQELIINNTGLDELNWHIEVPNDCNWLSVNPSSGSCTTEPNIVSLMIDVNEVDYGSYSCQLTVSDPYAANSPQLVTVNLEVLGPEFAVSPLQFYFETALDEPNDFNQVLSIQNTGYDTLYWDINIPDEYDWLNFSIYTGQTDSNQISEVILNIDHNNVEAGFYEFDITVSDPDAGNNPQVIPVEVQVLSHKGQRHVPSEYDTIQAAIDVAVDGDEVVIHPGVYTGEGSYYLTFNGKAITLRSIDPRDCKIVQSTVIDSGESLYVYNGLSFVNNEGPNSIVDGLTFNAFYMSAIYCIQSSPTIRNCIFKDGRGKEGGGGGGVVCSIAFPLIENCLFYNNLGGIEGGSPITIWNDYDPNQIVIRNCVIKCNTAYHGAGIMCCYANALIKNCTIASNNAIGDYFLQGSEEGRGGGVDIRNSIVDISNCIIWGNKAGDANEIVIADYVHSGYTPSRVSISYCDIKGGEEQILVIPDIVKWYDGLPIDANLAEEMLTWGDGNIDIDPCFAIEPNDGGDGWVRIYPPWIDSNDVLGNNEFGDVHLKSQNGRFVCDLFDKSDFNYDGITNLQDFAYIANRWNFFTQRIRIQEDMNFDMIVNIKDLFLFCSDYLKEKTYGQWVYDDVTSTCIDAGDHNSDWTEELWPHGKRINMGAYGGIPQASMSLSTTGNKADLNNDGFVNVEDLALFVEMWLAKEALLSEDINRNGSVNFSDFAIFADNWLWQQ